MAPSRAQWERLLQLLSKDRELVHGEFLAPNGVVRTEEKWEKIALELNAMCARDHVGLDGNGERWKEAWTNLRGRARKSCREMMGYRRGTGGGPDVDIAGLGLSELHEKVLNLGGVTAALGTGCPDPLRIQLHRQAAHQYAVNNAINEPDAEGNANIQVPNADRLLDLFVQEGYDAQGVAVAEPVPDVKQEPDAQLLAELKFMPNGEVWIAGEGLEEGLAALEIPKYVVKEEPGEEIGAAKLETLQDLETISLCDTPMKLRTPPRGSGLTPAGKRRPPADHSGFAAPKIPEMFDKAHPSVKEEACGGSGAFGQRTSFVKEEPFQDIETITLSDTPIKVPSPRGAGCIPFESSPNVQDLLQNIMTGDSLDVVRMASIIERNNDVLKKVVETLRVLKF